MFLGTTFIGFKNTTLPPLTNISEMNNVELSNGEYSSLYITKNITESQTESLNYRWDWDTVMHADYSEELTNAGNIDWTVETVSKIIVKRRLKDDFEWLNIASYDIETEEDFNIVGVDRLNQSGVEYEYAMVPYLRDDPGVYIIKDVKSKFDDIFIVGAKETYRTISSSGNIDTTRHTSGSYNVPLKSRYPVHFHSGEMNYDSGSVDGKFLLLKDDCFITLEDPGYFYKRGLMDFLTDGKPKILKNSDGRIWLIQVDGDPTDSADEIYYNRTISFQWIEIGDYKSISDLYYSGLVDIEPENW